MKLNIFIVVALTTLFLATSARCAEDGVLSLPANRSFTIGNTTSTSFGGEECEGDQCISRHELRLILEYAFEYVAFHHGYIKRMTPHDDVPLRIIEAINCLGKTDHGCHLIND